MSYLSSLSEVNETPQNESIPGRNDQVKNNASGYVFAVDPLMQLKRFLAIGTTAGTYYVGGDCLTKENIENIMKLLDSDYKQVIDITVEMSVEGRIPKNDTALVVFALALSHTSRSVRKYAADRFYEVVRTPTHLFTMAGFIKTLRGWGRLIRETFAKYYTSRDIDKLVYHVLKYQQRNGWKHLDLLRLCHVKPPTDFHNQLFGWLAGKKDAPEHPLIEAFLKLRKATFVSEVVEIIKGSKVTWEFVPTQFLKEPKVWEALLPNMPFNALVRNLARMSACGFLKPLTPEEGYIASKLRNVELIKKSRIHPINAAAALKTYASGRGHKGKLTWTVCDRIVEALNDLVMASFVNVEHTGKRYLVAIDVSGSMTANTAIESLNCMEVATIMGLYISKVEENTHTVVFSDGKRGRWLWGKDVVTPFPLGKYTSFESALKALKSLRFGATDCALPMLHALENKIPVDVFLILTDNETWYGKIHPTQALKKYREKMGINSKLISVGMAGTQYTIADPKDPYQVDLAGFDSATPKAIAEFAKL